MCCSPCPRLMTTSFCAGSEVRSQGSGRQRAKKGEKGARGTEVRWRVLLPHRLPVGLLWARNRIPAAIGVQHRLSWTLVSLS